MANARNLAEFVDANFDLLGGDNSQNYLEFSEDISQEELQEVNEAIVQNEAEEMAENDDSSNDFEPQSTMVRHGTCNNDEIDYFSKKKDKETTQQQTKWAVKVFRGKWHILQWKILNKSHF